MRASKIVLLSVFITAAILVVIGGVTANALANKSAAATPSPTAGPDGIQAYQQREAQYSQLIEQANQQLDKANAELQALQNQVNQLQQPPARQPAAPAGLSADRADQIARQAAGAAQVPLKSPELVQFQGKAAYEVSFDKGAVYVDAQTGEVLFNGTVPQEITADQAAQIVADYLNNRNILSVDQVTIGTALRYRVIFKNGTLAWVDLTGQITDIQLPSFGPPAQQASSNPTENRVFHEDDEHESD